jgi:Kef-type K+ transport system membrane component KefB
VSLGTLPHLLLALVVIVAAAWLFGRLARMLGQPAVVGEIVAGILLGPTLFGGAITTAIFPMDVRGALATLSNIGVCVFMFFVGLHFDHDLLRGQSRVATSVSVGAMLLPFGLGALLALYLAGQEPGGHRLAFILFLGTAMAITAFPVLARILSEKGLVRTPIGGLALACAALDDVLAWSLLALVVAIADTSKDPWRVLLIVPFAVLLLKVVRPQLARLAERHPRPGSLSSAGLLIAVGIGLLMCAEFTDWIGLHPIFGAFLFGAILPRTGARELRDQVLPRLEQLNAVVLLPVFFMVVGFKVNLSHLNASQLADLGLILVVAVGGKAIGAYAGARLFGARPRHSAVLAILINARGLTELIVLTVGLQLGLLDQKLYSLMVVMAVVTTAMTGVLLRLVYPPERVRQDIAERDAARAAEAAPEVAPLPGETGLAT